MITTHELDTARGRPAAGVPIVLERAGDDGWEPVGSGATDDRAGGAEQDVGGHAQLPR